MISSKDMQYVELIKKSLATKSLSELEALDRHFRSLVESEPKDYWPAWFSYNEFRIANIRRLPKTRPHVLTSGPINGFYPNYHIQPLFAQADVMALTCSSTEFSYYSSLPCQPSTLFLDILAQLPEGFIPDFYWDNQVEHLHYIPSGLEKAPFPIIASICHTYLHKSVQHICELFDYVLPLSKFQGSLLKNKYGEKIIDLPFGLNWGAFDLMITPAWDKSIDILLSFEASSNPIYENKRNLVIQAVKKFKQIYGDRFSIVIVSKLSKEDYLQLLKQSRIAINVTGINGPYNYRTIETLCAGTLLFQYEWENEFFENKFSELFIEGIHGIGFNLENLETKLLYYLEHRQEMEKIAKAGYMYLVENYSYKKLFTDFIDIIHNKTPFVFPRKQTSNPGLFHKDMIFYYQGNKKAFSSIGYGLMDLSHQTSWIRYNNLMIYASVIHKEHPHYNLLLLHLLDQPSYASKPAQKELLWNIYNKAKKEAPSEYTWIVEWNFFMVSLELQKSSQQAVIEMLQMLYELKPASFDEDQVIFKYYLSHRDYPDYNVSSTEFNKPLEFMRLNIELMKAGNNADLRASLHRDYAVKLTKYLLEGLSYPFSGS
jgi:glycosyltransferase involved in cell wall biosynthesis